MARSLDCTDVNRLVASRKNTTGSKLGLLTLLTRLHLQCLEQVENKRRGKFTQDQERILFENIRDQLKVIKNDLIRLDVENLNYIGISLRDYEIGGDVDFNKFLVKSLLSSYNGILEKNSGKPILKRLTGQEQIQLNRAWFSDAQAEIDNYLNVRRDSNSLHKIHSIVESFSEILHEEKKFPIEEKRLMAERIFYTIGEYLKSTVQTPNLSPDTVRSLEQQIPVRVLTKFRDDLSHYQIFPLLGMDDAKITELFHEVFSPILSIVRDTIIQKEKRFVQDLVKNSYSKIEIDVVREGIRSSSEISVKELIQYIEQIKGEYSVYRLPSNKSKRFVEEIYKKALKMKSKDFTIEDTFVIVTKLSKISHSFNENIQYNEETRLLSYEKLKTMGLPVEAHEDLVRITKLLCFLKNCPSAYEYDGILDSFLDSTKVLDKIKLSGVSLKDRLKPYYDPEALRSFKVYRHQHVEVLAKVLSKVERTSENRKLINFVESFIQMRNLEENYIPPDEYEGLINGLKINADDKEKFLLFSNEWRKKRCIELLIQDPPAAALIYQDIAKDKKPRSDFFDRLFTEYPPSRGGKKAVAQRILALKDNIQNKLEDLYSTRVAEEVGVLKYLTDPQAVKAQFIHIYSLLEKFDKEPHPNFRLLRNYLSHGNVLLGGEEDKVSAEVLVKLKDDVLSVIEDHEIGIEGVKVLIQFLESDDALRMIPKSISRLLCISGKVRTARSASESCLNWEEIDEFNEGGPENRELDNIVIDSEKFVDTISSEFEINKEKFANFITLASASDVVGKYKGHVDVLVNNHDYLNHFEKVGKFSGLVMHGMIAKDIIGDLFRGDYKDVAINVGFLTGSMALAKVAQFAAVRGAGLVLEGRVLLGNSLRFAAPILTRGVSAFIAYDLYNQVQAYKAGDKDALVPLVGDSIQLGIDTLEIGIEIGEVVGFEALAGVSAVTGPIGMAIGAVVFVGTQIYVAVRKVEKIDEQIHLTGWERFSQGIRAFFGGDASEYLKKLAEEKEANNQAVENAINFLKANPHFRRFVFSSIKAIDSSNVDNAERDPNPIFGNLDFTKVNPVLNSAVLLDQKLNNIKWTRTRPNSRSEINLFCLPKGDWESVPDSGTYYCDGAIGVDYLNNGGNNTLISLGYGRDSATGFPDSGNIFVLDKGNKEMVGGNKNDYFVFQKTLPSIAGSIDGFGGVDTVDVSALPLNYDKSIGGGLCKVSADFRQEVLRDTSRNLSLKMSNINQFIGRKDGVDEVLSACNTNRVDGKGGANKDNLDSIIIPKDDACPYQTTVVINPYTKVINNATRGDFVYYVAKVKKGSEAYVDLGLGSGLQTKNTFVFSYTLQDVATISRSQGNITFSFVEEFHKGAKQDIDAKGSFNLTISNAHKDTTKYQLIDSTQVVVGNKNVYAMQNTEKPIADLIQDYYSIAIKSHMYVVVHSNNEVLTIGNNNHNILMNDPSATKTYLVGGGGENVFVIHSGQEELTLAKLPISEVIIYDLDQNNSTDTVDLRKIKQQLKKDIDREIVTRISKIGGDLLISLSLDDASKKEILKVTLKRAVENNWYNRVHVVIDSELMIQENEGNFELAPRPLIFDDSSKAIYVVNPTDVVEGNRIKINKAIGHYSFARDDEALVITNSLHANADKNNPFTIILNQFYSVNNAKKMHTLTIELNNKKILLSSLVTIDARFNELTKKIMIDSYKAIIDSIRQEMLFDAIEENNFDRVKALISQGTNPNGRNEKDEYGRKPVHFAAAGNYKEMLDFFLIKGVSINEPDSNGWTPLHWALTRRQTDMVRYLVLKGAHVVAKDNKGYTPLYLARKGQNGYQDIVEFLKKSGIRLDLDDELKSILGETFTDLDGAESLIDLGADVNTTNYKGETILHLAASAGDLQLLKRILEKGANVNARDDSMDTPLHDAIYFFASSMGIVRLLVDKGANVNAVNAYYRTPLHLATIWLRTDVVKFLVENGANFNLCDKFGSTPLSIATKKGYSDIVDYFRKQLPARRGGRRQRKRRNHNEDHSLRNMTRKPVSTDFDSQPQIAASGASRPPSWIRDLFGWVNQGTERVKGLVRGWLTDNTATFKSESGEKISEIYTSAIDTSGTILLLDTLIRKATGQKHISDNTMHITELEANGYAINIAEGFEKLVKRASRNSQISMCRFSIDFPKVQGEITKKIISCKYGEILGVLDSYVQDICQGTEVDGLSVEEFSKFVSTIESGLSILLNQSMSRILNGKDNLLEIKEQQESPKHQTGFGNVSALGHAARAMAMERKSVPGGIPIQGPNYKCST